MPTRIDFGNRTIEAWDKKGEWKTIITDPIEFIDFITKDALVVEYP